MKKLIISLIILFCALGCFCQFSQVQNYTTSDAGQLINIDSLNSLYQSNRTGQPPAINACASTNNLLAPYNQNNGQRGIMFDITAITCVTIKCFESNFNTGTTNVQIYSRPGSHVGFTNSAVGWTLIGTATNLAGAGSNLVTAIPIPVNVIINAGATAAFYITRTTANGATIQYTNGVAVGTVFSSDANIQIKDGTGKDYAFGANFTPRRFNGRVFYNTGTVNITTPAISGPSPVCSGTIQSFSVPAVPGATAYNWTVPAGSTITSGQGTTTINVTMGGVSGNICVAPVIPCAVVTPYCFAVTISPPLTITTLALPATICIGATAQLSASGATTYTWTPAASLSCSVCPNPIATTTTTTTYTVNAANGGCTGSGTSTIVVNPLPVPTAINSGPYCSGQTISLTSSGGNAYSWSGPLTYTSAIQNPSIISSTTTMSGIYTVTASTVAGCTATATTTVTVNPMPSPVASNTGPYCAGDIINLSVAGGSTYSWSGPLTYTSANQNPSIISSTTTMSGIYTVTASTVAGCTATATTTVTVNPMPSPVASNAGPYCEFDAISISASGGSDYIWDGPNSFSSTNQNESFPSSTTTMSGIYTVTVSLGTCSATATTTLVINPLPTISVNSSSICIAQTTATLTATGALNYTWSSGTTPSVGNSVVADPQISSFYTVTGTDVNGCISSATATVTANALPVITVNSLAICPTLTATLTANGASTYAWSAGTSSPTGASVTVTPSVTSQYIVTGTDINGCFSSDTSTVTISPLPIATATNSGPYCQNDTISLNAGGGNGYLWDGPNTFSSTTQNQSIPSSTTIMSGVYSVTVSIGTCTAAATTTVIVNALPVVSVNSSAICITQTTATLTATGASTYAWSSGTTPGVGNSVSASPSTNSSYTVTGTDINGCINTAVSVVTANALPIVTVNSVAVCPTFTATLIANGAITYSWSPGTSSPTGSTVTASPALTTQYTVIGTDVNGCFSSDTSTVTINPNIIVDAGNDDTVCIGNNIVLVGNGGISGTTFTWNPGTLLGSNQNIVASASLTYTLSAVDPNGCTGSDSVIITVPSLITLSTSTVSASCQGICDGKMSVIASPSTGPFSSYTYLWSNNDQNANSVGVCAGNYTVLVTNDVGCVATASVSVTEPISLVAVASGINAASCNSVCDGSALITATGGTLPYSYTWSSLGVGNNPNNLCAGLYTCTVADSNGCSVPVGNISITQPSIISASVAVVSTICIGQTATLNSTATGGNGGYIFTWTGGTNTTSSASVTASPVVTTTYSVSVTDLNNCAAALATVVVNLNAALSVTTCNDITQCSGTTGAISAIGNGGDGTYTYSWATGTTPVTGNLVSVTPTVTTIYTVTVTDGCGTPSATDVVTINVNSLPVLNITTNVQSGCPPLCVNFTLTSLPAPTTSAWQFTSGQTLTNTSTTNICFQTNATIGATVIVTDINGCQNSFTNNSLVTINPLPQPAFSFAPQNTTAANPIINFTDLSTGATISNWLWNFGDAANSTSSQQNSLFDYGTAGTFNVTLITTSSSGCVDSVSQLVFIDGEFAIYVPNAFTPDADGQNDVFIPMGLGILSTDYHLYIFDRWGNTIFESTELNVGWNGKTKDNADYVQTDVYVWKIDLRMWNGTKKSLVGHVTAVK